MEAPGGRDSVLFPATSSVPQRPLLKKCSLSCCYNFYTQVRGFVPRWLPKGEPWCSVSSTFHTYLPLRRRYGTTHLSFLSLAPACSW